MRVLVNTRLLLKNKLEGIGWFTFETLKRITQNNPNDEFIFLFDRPFDNQFIFSTNIEPVVVGPPTRHPLLWIYWFEKVLPTIIKKYQPDVYLSPDGYLNLKTSTKQVGVIHDINFEHYPQWLPSTYAVYYKNYFKKFADVAARIATVSEYSKNDIVSTYKISPDKIDVVYNGCNRNYKPLSVDEVKGIRRKFSEEKPYILFIGSIHERKNLNNQLKAFEIVKNDFPNRFKFLVVGESMWNKKLPKKSKFLTDVVFLGRQNAADLAQIIGGAAVMSYVSLFEGFGIPILEGFSAGVPVVTSNVTAMPEIAAEAAIKVNPLNVNEIAEAYITCLTDESAAQNLAHAGVARLQSFSWDKTANLLWDCVNRAVYAD